MRRLLAVCVITALAVPLNSQRASLTQDELETEIILHVIYPCIATTAVVTAKKGLKSTSLASSPEGPLVEFLKAASNLQTERVKKTMLEMEIGNQSPVARQEMYKLGAAACINGALGRDSGMMAIANGPYLDTLSKIGW